MKNLIAPHGSDTLKPLFIQGSSERNSLTEATKEMPKLLLNSAAAANAVMLGAGYFTPLDGFMNKKNAINVAENMVTEDGLFWPVPIVNLSKTVDGITVGDDVALLDPNVDGTPVLAIQKISAIEKLTDDEIKSIASKIFGTLDKEHPGVANFLSLGNLPSSQGTLPSKEYPESSKCSSLASLLISLGMVPRIHDIEPPIWG